jgi:CRISPR-associated protein Csb2
MEWTLRIAVTLPGNRYHGSEWPSSPARLFRALLAGTMTGGYREHWEAVQPALEWLEKQPAPEIEAANAAKEMGYRISVPNNDMDIAAKEWQAGKPFDASALRTMKSVEPWKVEGTGPHLLYCWNKVDVTDEVVAGLRIASECLHTLGWGIDAAFATLLSGDNTKVGGDRVHWTPARRNGQYLALPTEGSLEDLRETYARFLKAVRKTDVNPDTRPMVFRQEKYGCGQDDSACIFFDLRKTDDSEKIYSQPVESTMKVAAWMRHAASQALLSEGFHEGWVNATALGHGEEIGRLSYVALPSIGHGHADGRLRRVMVVQEPGGMASVMELLEKKLTGHVLTDEQGKEVCRLEPPSGAGTVTPFYSNPAKRWRTVTPVVLHGFNSQRGVISLRKTERLLGQAFEKAGWDVGKIERLTFQAAPFFSGTVGAKEVRTPRHLAGWPRYHVAVDFSENVTGPLTAGLGRHYGIGVFARALA